MKFKLFYNAVIYSLDSDRIFDWMLVFGDRIAALGQTGDLPDLPDSLMEKIDLDGRTVIPSFTDAHTHFASTALYEGQISLHNAESLDDAIKILTDKKNKFLPGEWVTGGGYDRNLWEDGQPHRKYLDKIFPVNPVALDSKDGHALWVNTEALKRAGIGPHTSDQDGGKIVRDQDGRLTGVLYESAMLPVKKLYDETIREKLSGYIENLYPKFYRLGITSVHTMETWQDFNSFQMLYKSGQLKMRINMYLPQEDMEKLISARIRSGFGNEWIRVAGVKFFVDGSLGSQTAEMTQPYENSENYFGIGVMSEKDLTERIQLALRNGLACAVHAIGDRAVNKAVNAFEKGHSWQEQFKLTNRIEHAQLILPTDIVRLAKLNIIASMQPLHIADDVEIAELHWGVRSGFAYPMRALADAGVVLAFGSDVPVADPDPFKGIYTAVLRKYRVNPNAKSWHPERAVTLREALSAYTTGGALASDEIKNKGTLLPGKLADFIVLSKDVFKIPVEEILDLMVELTVLGGEVVFDKRNL
ncbi:MAG: amidohydrolase [Calditrichaceae bacterium]